LSGIGSEERIPYNSMVESDKSEETVESFNVFKYFSKIAEID